MTRKQEMKRMAEDIREAIDGARTHVHIGTWMRRPGVSLEIGLTKNTRGERIVVHKWDDEATCSVTHNKGDFWRDPDNAVTFGKVTDIDFTAERICAAAGALLHTAVA